MKGSETANIPLSDTRNNIESQDAGSIVGLVPSHRGLNSNDVCEVTSVISLSNVGYNSNSLYVGSDIVGEMTRHRGSCPSAVYAVARETTQSDVSRDGNTLNVGNDTECR